MRSKLGPNDRQAIRECVGKYKKTNDDQNTDNPARIGDCVLQIWQTQA